MECMETISNKIILILLLLPVMGWGQVVVIDSYSETIDNTIAIKNGTNFRAGQTFDCNGHYILDSVKVYLSKTGSPTGNVYINVYNVTGTYGTNAVPDGDSLLISNNIDASTLPSYLDNSSYIAFTFVFNGKIILTDKYYAFALCAYGGNSTNYIQLARRLTDASHSGNGIIYTTSWLSSTRDAIFTIYGHTTNALLWHNF